MQTKYYCKSFVERIGWVLRTVTCTTNHKLEVALELL
jgi:hypothetical protein